MKLLLFSFMLSPPVPPLPVAQMFSSTPSFHVPRLYSGTHCLRDWVGVASMDIIEMRKIFLPLAGTEP
jgi:hypothetical protein